MPPEGLEKNERIKVEIMMFRILNFAKFTTEHYNRNSTDLQ